MRDYGKVHTSFWASRTLKDLDGDAKLLALYLLTSTHTHMAGVFRLPPAYACDDLGWVPERLSNGFKTLSDSGWLARCEQTHWVWIRNFEKFNPPDNPNQRKAVDKQVALVPADCSFRAELLGSPEPLGNGSGNPPIPVPIPVLEKAPAKKAKPPLVDMPDDFAVSERVKRWAAEKGHSRLPEHLESFRAKAKAKGYRYTADGWDDAFMEAIRQNWARLDATSPQQPGGGRRRLG